MRYVVQVVKYFRGIEDKGAVVEALSRKKAIALASKQLKVKPSYLEAVEVKR